MVVIFVTILGKAYLINGKLLKEHKEKVKNKEKAHSIKGTSRIKKSNLDSDDMYNYQCSLME